MNVISIIGVAVLIYVAATLNKITYPDARPETFKEGLPVIIFLLVLVIIRWFV